VMLGQLIGLGGRGEHLLRCAQGERESFPLQVLLVAVLLLLKEEWHARFA